MNKRKSGFTLIELLIALAILGIVAVGAFGVSGGGSLFGNLLFGDVLFRRTVVGRVVDSGQSLRGLGNRAGGGGNIAVELDVLEADSKIRSTMDGTSLLMECHSTRCAVLRANTCANFDCKLDWRAFEPNVVACKLVRATTCPTATP